MGGGSRALSPCVQVGEPSFRKSKGKRSEDLAARYLEEQGLEILERNWRWRGGEIDLVARDGETLVFVEVRSLFSPPPDLDPIETITPRKIRKIRRSAELYLAQKGLSPPAVRFDVVGIRYYLGRTEIRHIPNAF